MVTLLFLGPWQGGRPGLDPASDSAAKQGGLVAGSKEARLQPSPGCFFRGRGV